MKKIFILVLCCVLTSCDDVQEVSSGPQCNENIPYLKSTFSKWLGEKLPSNISLEVLSLENFFEIKSVPTFLGTTLYDDIKDSKLCKTTVKVMFTNKDTQKNRFGEITVRYQLLTSLPNSDGTIYSGIQMSGRDVQEMSDAIRETISDIRQ